VLVCGKGGSSVDTDHRVAELMKGFEAKRPLSSQFLADLKRLYPEDAVVLYMLQGALPAIALSAHVALCLAIANDNHPSMIFAQQVIGYGVPGDVLFAISTSGNCLDVVNAAKVARAKGLRTVASLA
jgi:D-sedoheptulose 7-phosphate isomerase